MKAKFTIRFAQRMVLTEHDPRRSTMIEITKILYLFNSNWPSRLVVARLLYARFIDMIFSRVDVAAHVHDLQDQNPRCLSVRLFGRRLKLQ